MDTQDLQRIKNQFDIIGNNAGLNRALEMAVAIAPTDLTVLVTGESGVGKETIPNIIHKFSRRKNNKYFAINCGAIPEGTIDAELFGHVKGSFTGAVDSRKGYFEEYDGGTLFLDEIGELPLPSQAKLLRVLQSGEFVKVGSSTVQKTNVRVIAATNVDLLHAVGKGKFRADLYYRLNAVQISMPSLRERKDDIYTLFRKFSSDFSEAYGMNKVTLTNDAIQLLSNYRWPGNIRQLKNVTEAVTALESQKLTPMSERCVVDAATLALYMPKEDTNLLPVAVGGSASGDSISDVDKQSIFMAIKTLTNEVEMLKSRLDSMSAVGIHPAIPQAPQTSDYAKPADEPDDAEWQGPGAPVAAGQQTKTVEIGKIEPQVKTIEELEIENIKDSLERNGGNRRATAEELGISERTLYRKIEKYNLAPKPEK